MVGGVTTTLVEPKIVEAGSGGDGERPLHIARVEGVKVALCGYVGGDGEPWQKHGEVDRRGLCVECLFLWADLPDEERSESSLWTIYRWLNRPNDTGGGAT